MNSDDLYDRCNEDPEYLDNVLVDICSRSIILFSNHGNQTDVTCETPKQFIETLTAIRDNVDEEDIYFKKAQGNKHKRGLVLKINIWYSSHATQWRWVLTDENNHQESGGQEDLRSAMNDIANTIENLGDD